MGEAKARREQYPDTYGTEGCPGAGFKRPAIAGQELGRWLTQGHFEMQMKNGGLVPVYFPPSPLVLGRNAEKRAKRATEKAMRLAKVRERARVKAECRKLGGGA